MTFATDVADGVLACFYDDTRVDKAFLTIDVANGNLRIFGKEVEEK
uniref:DUF2262 domain-containing protein n=2 Tax=Bursaphelenchus xylophilus TaxID=6326 RepID=A0A1I7SKC0_BURXY